MMAKAKDAGKTWNNLGQPMPERGCATCVSNPRNRMGHVGPTLVRKCHNCVMPGSQWNKDGSREYSNWEYYDVN